jgi:hypothetical protein
MFYRGLYNLVNHVVQMKSEDRQALVVRTVILLKCLMESGYFPTNSTEKTLTETQLYISELLFHFQAGIQYNLHAVYQVIDIYYFLNG